MARKKVIDLNADSTFKFEKPGQELEGYYIGSKTVNSGMGPSKLHVLQTAEGSVGAWGSAQLDAKLAQIQAENPGAKVFIKYTKKIKVPKGMMKVFEVEYDDEDRIDVGGTQVNFRDASEPEAEEAEEGAEEQQEEEGAEAEAADEPAEEEQQEEEQEEEQPAPKQQAAKTPAPAAKKPATPPAATTQKPRTAAPSPEAQARAAALLNRKK
jgi:hypothetical protein